MVLIMTKIRIQIKFNVRNIRKSRLLSIVMRILSDLYSNAPVYHRKINLAIEFVIGEEIKVTFIIFLIIKRNILTARRESVYCGRFNP
jgi:hypothetical protein